MCVQHFLYSMKYTPDPTLIAVSVRTSDKEARLFLGSHSEINTVIPLGHKMQNAMK